ncbi:MAG: P-loop NTPase fold protein [Egibacteraceae bacterium]
MLGTAGVRRYAPDELHAFVRDTPADIPVGTDVERILALALNEIPNPDPDGPVPVRVLFGALLELDNPASQAIRRQIAAKGVDAGAVVASYRDFLASHRIYTAFLRERHPCPPDRVEVPDYQADQPPRRQPPDDPGPPDDLVGIDAEVDAFACLIASRTLTPPLAIGLFGDWGSGKSFFLRALQRRIDSLVNEEPGHEPPFHRHIVQIEFNAWQYVEGNLWASLVEHIFRNLRTSSHDGDDLLAERQRHWIERLRVTDVRREGLQEQRQRLSAEMDRLREDPLADWDQFAAFRQAVDQAAAHAGLPKVAAEVDALRGALADARDVLRRTNPLLEALRGGGWRTTAGIIAVIALAPVISWWLTRLDWSAVSNAAATIAWVLASAVATVKRGTGIIEDRLAQITAAEEQLGKQLAQVEDELRTLDTEAAEIEAELADITPASVLAEFLTERTGSDDYRRHLGVPALIRRDLERLWRLVEHENALAASGGPPGEDKYRINRIVLCIDDLDRCPEALVVQVLQAVHLLLAFPLFVVVVAVDERWLARSLEAHYGPLLDTGKAGAGPDDYLEKIFQVPFWVQPLDAQRRRRLARGLLAPSLGASDAPGAGPDRPPDSLEEITPAFSALVESFFDTQTPGAPGRAWREAARLTVTAGELALIDEVAPLLGQTPRSVKRFVNIHQLIKAMSRPRAADGAVILLLAVATSLPELARGLFAAIDRHEGGPFELAKIVEDLGEAGEPLTTQADQLAAWLAAHPVYERLDPTDLPHWTALIRRFSLRLGDR